MFEPIKAGHLRRQLNPRLEVAKGDAIMEIEDHPDFPRFNVASTALRDAEDRVLQALKKGDKAELVAAKLALMGALDEYGKVASRIGNDD